MEWTEQGWPKRWVTRREAEWDDAERGKFLAWAQHKALTCTGCGGWLPETTVADATDYEVPPPHRCAGCTQLSIVQKSREKDDAQPQALRWSVHRRT